MDPSKCTFAFHGNNSDQIAGSYELDSGDHWLSRSVKFNLASPKVGCLLREYIEQLKVMPLVVVFKSPSRAASAMEFLSNSADKQACRFA